MFKRAIAIRERNFGPDHPLVAKSLSSYAALLHATGREAEARKLAARAHAIRQRREGGMKTKQ